MRTIAFVGPSGTGKSHKAVMVAKRNGACAIIDDGILISANRVVAGVSAKRAKTKLASVRQALFINEDNAKTMREAIDKLNPECIMLLGTSDAMVTRIAQTLNLPEIEKFIYIDEVSSKEEMEKASNIRKTEGKHIIPVPSFEIKKDFSGYFMHPLRFFKKNVPEEDQTEQERTIVRPSFSYLGNYTISDNVIISIAKHEALKEKNVQKVTSVNLRTSDHGIHIDMVLSVKYGENIIDVCNRVQKRVKSGIENNTCINVRRAHIFVKSLYID